jgi:hypothetical protein
VIDQLPTGRREGVEGKPGLLGEQEEVTVPEDGAERSEIPKFVPARLSVDRWRKILAINVCYKGC